MTPWNIPAHDADRTSHASNPAVRTLEEALLTQQRYWSAWMEASQLWLSWWVSTLPPMPWPPAGQVLPPPRPDAPLAPQPEASRTQAKRPDRQASRPSTPANKPRASAVRHH